MGPFAILLQPLSNSRSQLNGHRVDNTKHYNTSAPQSCSTTTCSSTRAGCSSTTIGFGCSITTQPASFYYKFQNVQALDTPIQPEPGVWLTNDKGVTYHKDHIHYKVNVKCKWCCTSYTTEWGHGSAPYEEMKARGWTQGKDRSGNWTWQQARCPICGICVRAFESRWPR